MIQNLDHCLESQKICKLYWEDYWVGKGLHKEMVLFLKEHGSDWEMEQEPSKSICSAKTITGHGGGIRQVDQLEALLWFRQHLQPVY
jgi:hypothetical protein